MGGSIIESDHVFNFVAYYLISSNKTPVVLLFQSPQPWLSYSRVSCLKGSYLTIYCISAGGFLQLAKHISLLNEVEETSDLCKKCNNFSSVIFF